VFGFIYYANLTTKRKYVELDLSSFVMLVFCVNNNNNVAHRTNANYLQYLSKCHVHLKIILSLRHICLIENEFKTT